MVTADLSSEAYKWQAIPDMNNLLLNLSSNTDDATIVTALVLFTLEASDLVDSTRQRSDRQ